jgi:hypothetical protein
VARPTRDLARVIFPRSSAGFAGAIGLWGRLGRGAQPPSEQKSYRDVKHYKRRKRWLS